MELNIVRFNWVRTLCCTCNWFTNSQVDSSSISVAYLSSRDIGADGAWL